MAKEINYFNTKNNRVANKVSYYSKPESFSLPKVNPSKYNNPKNFNTNTVGPLYTNEERIMGKIKFPIPDEIKKSYQKSRHLLEENYNLTKCVYQLDCALKENLIIDVLEAINTVTTKSSNGWVNKEGFFKEYQEWLEESLTTMFSQRQIDTSRNKEDMIACLFISQRVLNQVPYSDTFEREELITQAEEIYFRYKGVINCSPMITEICETFIDLGLENIKYEDNEIKRINSKPIKIKKIT